MSDELMGGITNRFINAPDISLSDRGIRAAMMDAYKVRVDAGRAETGERGMVGELEVLGTAAADVIADLIAGRGAMDVFNDFSQQVISEAITAQDPSRVRHLDSLKKAIIETQTERVDSVLEDVGSGNLVDLATRYGQARAMELMMEGEGWMEPGEFFERVDEGRTGLLSQAGLTQDQRIQATMQERDRVLQARRDGWGAYLEATQERFLEGKMVRTRTIDDKGIEAGIEVMGDEERVTPSLETGLTQVRRVLQNRLANVQDIASIDRVGQFLWGKVFETITIGSSVDLDALPEWIESQGGGLAGESACVGMALHQLACGDDFPITPVEYGYLVRGLSDDYLRALDAAWEERELEAAWNQNVIREMRVAGHGGVMTATERARLESLLGETRVDALNAGVESVSASYEARRRQERQNRFEARLSEFRTSISQRVAEVSIMPQEARMASGSYMEELIEGIDTGDRSKARMGSDLVMRHLVQRELLTQVALDAAVKISEDTAGTVASEQRLAKLEEMMGRLDLESVASRLGSEGGVDRVLEDVGGDRIRMQALVQAVWVRRMIAVGGFGDPFQEQVKSIWRSAEACGVPQSELVRLYNEAAEMIVDSTRTLDHNLGEYPYSNHVLFRDIGKVEEIGTRGVGQVGGEAGGVLFLHSGSASRLEGSRYEGAGGGDVRPVSDQVLRVRRETALPREEGYMQAYHTGLEKRASEDRSRRVDSFVAAQVQPMAEAAKKMVVLPRVSLNIEGVKSATEGLSDAKIAETDGYEGNVWTRENEPLPSGLRELKSDLERWGRLLAGVQSYASQLNALEVEIQLNDGFRNRGRRKELEGKMIEVRNQFDKWFRETANVNRGDYISNHPNLHEGMRKMVQTRLNARAAELERLVSADWEIPSLMDSARTFMENEERVFVDENGSVVLRYKVPVEVPKKYPNEPRLYRLETRAINLDSRELSGRSGGPLEALGREWYQLIEASRASSWRSLGLRDSIKALELDTEGLETALEKVEARYLGVPELASSYPYGPKLSKYKRAEPIREAISTVVVSALQKRLRAVRGELGRLVMPAGASSEMIRFREHRDEMVRDVAVARSGV